MPVNQPKITGDPVQDSWSYEVSQVANDLEARVEELEDAGTGGAAANDGAAGAASGGIPITNNSGAQITTLASISYDSENAVINLIGADFGVVNGAVVGTHLSVEDRANTIPLNELKAVTAASTDFADFQTRIAALTGN